MTRDEAIDLIITLEGGYVHDAHDPGGETKFGISKRSHPKEDIGGLTVKRAAEIYRDDYWNPTAGRIVGEAPGLAVLVFDAAVNQGPRAAAQLLQKVVGTVQDGVIGPMTIAALRDKADQGEQSLMVDYAAERAMRYVETNGWSRYGRGWMRRLMTVLARASTTVEAHTLDMGEVRAIVLRALDSLEE